MHLRYSLFGPFHIAVDEHLSQASFDNGLDEPTIISADSLEQRVNENNHIQRGYTLTSIPLVSILSYFLGLVQYKPAYRFLLISKYGKYTFSNSNLIGRTNLVVTYSAASAPRAIMSARSTA